MANMNSTTAKKYIQKMQFYPKTKQFDEDIITLMALSKIGYKDIEAKRNELFKKYSSYYESYGCKQRIINYSKYENEGLITAQGKRTYETSAPVKLDKMIEIYNSKASDESKIFLMHEIFRTPEDFFDRFKDLYPVFMNTDRMKAFVDVYSFINSEKNSMNYEKINYMDEINSQLEIYPEALRVLKKYVNSPCYSLSLFLKQEKITEAKFKSYVNAVKLLRPNLYMEVMETKEENSEKNIQKQKERFAANMIVISDIINSIIECKKNNEDYDLLEFYKKVPFKNSHEFFIAELLDFTYKHLTYGAKTLANYVYSHNMHARTKIVPVNYQAIYNPNCTTIINGILFDETLDLSLIDYLKRNDYPMCQNTLRIARNKYANGELELNSDKKIVKKRVLEVQE